jgi:hypothetical protein
MLNIDLFQLRLLQVFSVIYMYIQVSKTLEIRLTSKLIPGNVNNSCTRQHWTQDTERRQTKQKKHPRKLKKIELHQPHQKN